MVSLNIIMNAATQPCIKALNQCFLLVVGMLCLPCGTGSNFVFYLGKGPPRYHNAAIDTIDATRGYQIRSNILIVSVTIKLVPVKWFIYIYSKYVGM